MSRIAQEVYIEQSWLQLHVAHDREIIKVITFTWNENVTCSFLAWMKKRLYQYACLNIDDYFMQQFEKWFIQR